MKKSVILCVILLAIAASAHTQVLENKPPRDGFYDKENNYGKKPKDFTFVREADLMVKKRVWRMIDFREKFNQFYYYPIQPVQDRVSFMSMVTAALEEGKIGAFDNMNDDFRKPVTYEEFITANTSTKPVEREDLENPGQTIQSMDTTSFQTADVKQLRIKEDWYIDRQRGERGNRILGLGPVVQLFDDNGELKGNTTLFWLYYDDCRDVFVNTESFNRHNSALRMSYDDAFAFKRFFNSYIYKIDNQQDRQIQDYMPAGWQVAQEAERLKVELLNEEEDLWEY